MTLGALQYNRSVFDAVKVTPRTTLSNLRLDFELLLIPVVSDDSCSGHGGHFRSENWFSSRHWTEHHRRLLYCRPAVYGAEFEK